MKNAPPAPHRTLTCVLCVAGGFGMGWLLKPSEPPAASGKPSALRQSSSPNTRPSPSATAASGAGDKRAPQVRGRFLPKDGREPETLLERLRFAFADTRAGMQELAFVKIIGEMGAAEAPAVLQMLNEIEAGGDRMVHAQRKAFYIQWGEVAPSAALDSIKQESGHHKSILEYTDQIMEGWAAQDMPRALKALNDESDNSFRNRLLGGLVITYASQDLQTCTKWALSQDPADAAACGISLGWVAASSYGLATGVPWYRDLPNDGPGGIKENAWQGVSQVAQKVGGKAFMDLIASSSDLPWCQPSQIAGAVNAASTAGIASGLDYLAALPEAGLKKLGSSGYNSLFQESSYSEAAAWLKAHPTVPAYDILVGEFSSRLRSQDPAAASEWVATIHDPALRKNAGAPP